MPNLPAKLAASIRALLCAALLAAGVPRPALAESHACPRPTAALPPEAQPSQSPDPHWQGEDQGLQQKIAATDLAGVRLLFVGDSITANWSGFIFDKFYATRGPLNLGLHGDTTQGTLWRLGQLPLGQSLRPQLVVLLIGTNDLWPGAQPRNIALGIAQNLRLIRQRSPHSRVLLVGLLPRGGAPNDPLRLLAGEVNRIIRNCADGRAVFYAQPGDMLLDGHGALSNQIAYDYLHPTWLGYAILGAGLEPIIGNVMGPH